MSLVLREIKMFLGSIRCSGTGRRTYFNATLDKQQIFEQETEENSSLSADRQAMSEWLGPTMAWRLSDEGTPTVLEVAGEFPYYSPILNSTGYDAIALSAQSGQTWNSEEDQGMLFKTMQLLSPYSVVVHVDES